MSTGMLPIPQIVGSCGSFYEKCYISCNPDINGNISSLYAAEFLKSSGLDDSILSEIWDLSDSNTKGYLNKYDFFVALKLVSLAQNKIDPKLINLQVFTPSPKLNSCSPITILNSKVISTNSWGITLEEQAKYTKIFESLNPHNNKLSGDSVKPIFLNSKLSVAILAQIWNLADIDMDGYLDLDEFCISMHFIYKCLNGDDLPKILPINLIPLSKRRPSSTNSFLMPNTNASTSSFSSSQSNFLNSFGSNISSDWEIGKLDKEKYDSIFLAADKDKDGFVSGSEIKQLFVISGLSQDDLAKIWDLSDINKTGLLNREQFSIAMYLINEQISSHGTKPIPFALPYEMIPPSLRFKFPESANFNEVLTLNSFGINSGSDDVYKEIDILKKEKSQVEQICRQLELDVRTQVQEVQELQSSLDRSLQMAHTLAAQKDEAQHRLDELTEQRSRTQILLDEIRQKCSQEREQLDALKRQLSCQTTSIEEKREELKRLQSELNDVIREETLLKDQVQKHLVKVTAIEQETIVSEEQISVAEENNQSLESIKSRLQNVLEEYESFIANPESNIRNLTDLEIVDELVKKSIQHTGMKSKSIWPSEDHFQKDLFCASVAPDPFGGNDPFSPVIHDPFSTNSGWGNTGNIVSDQNSAFSIGNLDEFFNNKSTSDSNFGFKSQHQENGNDPFGFGDSPFDQLPEKSLPPPRPAKAPQTNASRNSKSVFSDSACRTAISENDQFIWGKPESGREIKKVEALRKREQTDLELSGKLSQLEMKTSDHKKNVKSKK